MPATPFLILQAKQRWIDRYLGICCLIILFAFCILTGFGFASIFYLLVQPEKTAPAQVALYMDLKLKLLRDNCEVIEENISHSPNPRGDDIRRQAVRFRCPTGSAEIPHEIVFWSSLQREQGGSSETTEANPSL